MEGDYTYLSLNSKMDCRGVGGQKYGSHWKEMGLPP